MKPEATQGVDCRKDLEEEARGEHGSHHTNGALVTPPYSPSYSA